MTFPLAEYNYSLLHFCLTYHHAVVRLESCKALKLTNLAVSLQSGNGIYINLLCTKPTLFFAYELRFTFGGSNKSRYFYLDTKSQMELIIAAIYQFQHYFHPLCSFNFGLKINRPEDQGCEYFCKTEIVRLP